ncbi:MAG: type 4a pilus biogenesis protein PilO, partial [Caldicoprobacterales bacterium]
DSLQNIIPSHKNHVDLLDYLISIFTEHNVQIIQLEFDSYIDKESYKELPVNLSMKGQYSDIIDVIEDFKMGSKPLRIDQLHMDKTDNHLTYCDLLAYAFISDKAD